MPRITGASVWEQEIYDYVSGHVATEAAILDEYQRLADDESGSPAFRYLANLILADERRHHQLFNDLAAAVRQMGEMRLEDEPIPSLHGLRADRERTGQLPEGRRGCNARISVGPIGLVTMSDDDRCNRPGAHSSRRIA
jgi:hypothetical protein